MRIQSLQTYKVLQQIKHFNAYTIILIYYINPDGGELTLSRMLLHAPADNHHV